jgi:3-dehydroquinate dehydratase-2
MRPRRSAIGSVRQLRPKLDIVRKSAANSPAMSKILVVHGPNLNLLGDRETQHYGRDTLEAINDRLVEQGRKAGPVVETFQGNAEAPLTERIHAPKSEETAYIIIDPAAFTQASVALRDALSRRS